MVRIILHTKNGQLANRLLHLCSFISFADQFHAKIWYPGIEDYAHYFEIYRKSTLPTYPQNSNYVPFFLLKPARKLIFKWLNLLIRILRKIGLREGIFHKIIEPNEFGHLPILNQDFYNTISSKKIVFVQGWGFRSELYPENSLRNVINTTRFLSSYYLKAEDLFKKLNSEGTLIIGVHIRRGDYEHFEGGRYFYSLINYVNWMRQVNTLFGKNLTFVICSNENLKYSDQLLNCELDIRHADGHLITDLITLSKCDYIIGPPSTYSMWASFIGKKPLEMIRSSHHSIQVANFKIFKPEEKHGE
jgi:hypothetical protein